jgi:integrase/recombinase XerD
MLQTFFDSPKRVQALRDCPMGASFESFAQELCDARYARLTVRGYLRAAEHFMCWVGRQGVPVQSLDETFIDRFDRHLNHCRCPNHGKSHRLELLHCAGMFLRHLRKMGLVTTAIVEVDGPALLVKFRRWMHQQRGTGERTLQNYCLPIRDFLNRTGNDLARIDATRLRQFVLQRRRRGAGAVRTCTNALRAFCCFLIAEDRCPRDLVAAIPISANWQRASLPRYWQPGEVELRIGTRTVLVGK